MGSFVHNLTSGIAWIAGWRPAALALLAASCMPGHAAADGALPEYDVKAALIINIAKFVRWPEGAMPGGASRLTLCIIGRDDFGPGIDALSARSKNQGIAVRRLAAVDPSVAGCHIAFISRSERDDLAAELAALARLPVLTVSDIDAFASQGGMVELATVNNKINFQINRGASRRAGLDIAAQLLQLASLVDDDRPSVKP